MHRLTLIRHAKAVPAADAGEDFRRKLTARGERDAEAMARHLAGALERPLRLLASPAPRALATAHHFAAALSLADDAVESRAEIYDASAGELLALVNQLADATTHAVLCGHNPGLTELGRLLAAEPFPELPTCAVATLGFDAEHWRELVSGSGHLLRYVDPSALGG